MLRAIGPLREMRSIPSRVVWRERREAAEDDRNSNESKGRRERGVETKLQEELKQEVG